MMTDNFKIGTAVTVTDWMAMSFRARYGIKTFYKADMPEKPLPYQQWPFYAREDDYITDNGVRALMRNLANAGVNTVFWRVTNGGLLLYPSSIGMPMNNLRGANAQNKARGEIYLKTWQKADFRCWNPILTAVDEGHKLDMEVYAWYTFREEDHGCVCFAPFSEENQHLCQVDRRGRTLYANLSWEFDEVVEYKRKIIEEIVSFGVDGILLDYCRKNAFKSTPHTKVTECFPGGYEPSVVEDFHREHNINPSDLEEFDPVWTKFRADRETGYLRNIREWTSGLRLGVMVYESHNLQYHRLDVETWDMTNLIDFCVPVFQDRPFNHIHDPNHVRPCKQYPEKVSIGPELLEITRICRNHPVYPGIYCYDFVYDNFNNPNLNRRIIKKRLRESSTGPAQGMVVFESNHIALSKNSIMKIDG